MSDTKTAYYYPDSPLLRDIARELADMYGDLLDLKYLNIDSLLFVEDQVTEAKVEKIAKGEAKVFEVKELHPALAERLKADYLVIYYKLNGLKIDLAKLNAYFLEALLRITPAGGLRKPDVNTFFALAHALGPDWKQKKFVSDVRMGELLKGATVQQTLENLRFDKETGEVTMGNVLPMRPTGTERGA